MLSGMLLPTGRWDGSYNYEEHELTWLLGWLTRHEFSMQLSLDGWVLTGSMTEKRSWLGFNFGASVLEGEFHQESGRLWFRKIYLLRRPQELRYEGTLRGASMRGEWTLKAHGMITMGMWEARHVAETS